MLSLVSDLEERIEELKKENQNIKEQLIELEISVDELNKEKDPANPPSKKSP